SRPAPTRGWPPSRRSGDRPFSSYRPAIRALRRSMQSAPHATLPFGAVASDALVRPPNDRCRRRLSWLDELSSKDSVGQEPRAERRLRWAPMAVRLGYDAKLLGDRKPLSCAAIAA